MKKGHRHGRQGRDKGFPSALKRAMNEAGLATDDLIFSCTGDMNIEMCYCSCWIFFDNKGLYVVAGRETAPKRSKRNVPPEMTCEISEIRSYPIEEIEKLITERYVTTGSLIMESGGEQVRLTYYSSGYAGGFANLENAFNSYKRTGTAEIPSNAEPQAARCRKCGAPCPPGKEFCPKHSSNLSVFVRLLGFFKRYIPQTLALIVSMLAGSALAVYLPQVSTRSLYDDVLSNPQGLPAAELLKALGVLVLTVIGLRLINTVINVLQDMLNAVISPSVQYDLKTKIFDSMQRLSVGFYSSKQTGALMDRVMEDSTRIYWFLVDGVPRTIIDTLTLVGVLAVMFIMNVKLSLAAVCSMPVIFISLFFGNRVFRNLYHKNWTYRSRVSSMVSDNVNGQRVIKAFAREDGEYEKFEKVSGDLEKSETKIAYAEATMFPLMEVFALLLSTLVMGYGGVLVARGELKTGELLSYIVYLQMLREPFAFLSRMSSMWANTADAATRVFEVCDALPDIVEKPDAVSLGEIRGDVEINELDFEYEPARPVIKKLNLSVKAGDMLGIVGKTGAGKTTIANLIARLYDAKLGSVKIDGVDVRDLSFSDLRGNVGMVSQDIYLFMGSIADNIRYAKPDASMDEVIAAAKAASAHDFIMKLPDAYETRIGAGSQSLSGGERQRISIARTIIQNPKILILDEATAAMDTETERNIQESLTKLKKGRTTIAIAHRLSTLRDSDYLAVIDDGRIVEYGTYAELLRQKGEFYRQYKIQYEALKLIGIGSDADVADDDDVSQGDE